MKPRSAHRQHDIDPTTRTGNAVTFLYEKLSDKSFQKLCQAVLAKLEPGVIAFPVGQKDGGRDAATRLQDVVYQVKHSSKPEKIKDPVKWLLDAIDGEMLNIERLYSAGTRTYYLLTNVSGSAAANSGQMDKLRQALALKLNHLPGLSATAWWRETIDSHVIGDLAIQWAYPSMLTGTQAMALLMGQLNAREDNRQASAISGYLASEYEATRLLRFKQVGLEATPLTALFVDVPATPAKATYVASSPQWERMIKAAPDPEASMQLKAYSDNENAAFAASLLLSGDPVTRIVISGGPGQGKSTLLQYICQLHRSRLLDVHDLTFPAEHLATSLRLPFHVDLSRFATWLRSHPESSLEEYVASLVQAGSGGATFTVTDLHEVLTSRPAIFALDALDEVPNRSLRSKVTTAIERAGTRLARLSPNSVIVVTTRPSFYTNEGTLEPDRYLTLDLLRLPQYVADDYLEKWLVARSMNSEAMANLRRLWATRRNDPHIGSLTVNVMQLSILLYLMHVRGNSLPDQRTQLYDEYTRMLLDRESDKDRRVAENRDQLIEVHGYVAFHLQAAAEEDGSSGAISESELTRLIREYQDAAGYDTDMSDMFAGVQRVVALVANQRGAFEFEVQPLREYFAARFLYDTAPYVPATGIRRGQKDDRLLALLRRPYWANVLRFYAGCFTSGELAGLLDTLMSAAVDDHLPVPAITRSVVRQLLNDRLFNGKPMIERRALDFAYDSQAPDLGATGHALMRVGQNIASRSQVQYARDLMAEYLTAPSGDLMRRIRTATGDFLSRSELASAWRDIMPGEKAATLSWVALGGGLGCTGALTLEERSALDRSLTSDSERIIAARASIPATQSRDEVVHDLTLLLRAPLETVRSAKSAAQASYLYSRIHPSNQAISLTQADRWWVDNLDTPDDGLLAEVSLAVATAKQADRDPRIAALVAVAEATGDSWGVTASALVRANTRTRNNRLVAADEQLLRRLVEPPLAQSRGVTQWQGAVNRLADSSEPWERARIATQAIISAGATELSRIASSLEGLITTLPDEWLYDVFRVVNFATRFTGSGRFGNLTTAETEGLDLETSPYVWLLAYPSFRAPSREMLIGRLAQLFTEAPFRLVGGGKGVDALLIALWARVQNGTLDLESLGRGLEVFHQHALLSRIEVADSPRLVESISDFLRQVRRNSSPLHNLLERQLLACLSGDITAQAREDGWFVPQ